MMKKFYQKHPELILAIIAFVFVGILIAFFVWGINDIFFEVHRATVSFPPESSEGFNLQAASQIDYHGLSTSTSATNIPSGQPSSVQAPISVSAPTSNVTSTVATSTLKAPATLSSTTATSTKK
jgi:hypothetical protein